MVEEKTSRQVDHLPEMEAVARTISTCPLCDLALTRTKAVPGEGSHHAELMFIGEGPGFNEDQEGRPFVGRAGQFLNQLIGLIGVRREDVYITNVVKCRPPNNRDPLPDELLACRPYLFKQIELIRPRVIVTLGRFSLATFFPGVPIARIHGVFQYSGDLAFFPMYHPAAALHQQKYHQTIIDDMNKLGVWLRETQNAEVQTVLLEETDDKPVQDQTQLALF